MPVGPTDASKRGLDDPALDAALAEMASDGFNAADPVTLPTQDDAQPSAEPTPAAAAPSDPAPDGDPGPDTPDASPDAPDADPASSPADDPLAGTEPFTYTVNGQSRTMDGVYRIPNEGLIVPEEKVPAFQLMASRADALESANREQYHRLQQLESLTAWTTQGPDGTEHRLTGPAALEARAVAHAKTLAVAQVLADAIERPEVFSTLIGIDDAGNVIPSRMAVEHLLARAQLAGLTAERDAKSQFQGLASQASTPAPVSVEQAAPIAAEHFAKQAGLTNLAPEDLTFYVNFLKQPGMIRQPTAQDIQADPSLKDESLMVDKAFLELLARDAKRLSPVAPAPATTKAQQFNAAQQQARGSKVKPAARPAPSPQSRTPTAAPKSRAEAWDAPLNSALIELGIS